MTIISKHQTLSHFAVFLGVVCRGMLSSTSFAMADKALSVGDQVCMEGFVMDVFCIDRGTLLDAPSVVTLLNPELHSYHCLLDVPPCFQSGYEILMDPMENMTMYTRGLKLDDTGNSLVLNVGRAHGDTGSCTTCTAENATKEFGFRAVVMGMITELGDGMDVPPTISTTSLEEVDMAMGCPDNVTNMNEFLADKMKNNGTVLGEEDTSNESVVTQAEETTTEEEDTSGAMSAVLKVGDDVCMEGFVMDVFCINRGTLLDAPSVVTLLNPELHSYHCLLDVPPCFQSGYEILMEPMANMTMYTRGLKLDDTGNSLVLNVGRAHGDTGSCTTCTAEKATKEFGFRAVVMGKITDLGDGMDVPPTIMTTSLEEVELAMGCPNNVTSMNILLEEMMKNNMTDVTKVKDPTMSESSETSETDNSNGMPGFGHKSLNNNVAASLVTLVVGFIITL